MKKLFLVATVYILYIASMKWRLYSGANVPVDTIGMVLLALGLITTLAWYLGGLAQKIKLPAITGYLLAGFLFGPYILRSIDSSLVVLNIASIDQLELINSLALGVIALTAGGELKLSMIRERWKTLLSITVAQIVIVIAGVSVLVVLMSMVIPVTAAVPLGVMLGIGLLLGVVATAKSPSAAIAIINECQSSGPVTEISLGITVIGDMVVMIMFTIVVTCAKILILPGESINYAEIGKLAWEIFGSLGVGCLLGWLLVVYVDRVNKELPLIVLAVAFLSMSVFHDVHLSGLLICMVAGFFVENFSKHGDALIHAIEEHSYFIYVIFFSIAGASLDLPTFFTVWPVALFLVLARTGFTFLGTFLPAKYVKAETSVQRYAWLSFISQAGVSLGLAIMIEKAFVDVDLPFVIEGMKDIKLGALLKNLILGTIVINQLLGPVVFKFALAKSGEIGKRAV